MLTGQGLSFLSLQSDLDIKLVSIFWICYFLENEAQRGKVSDEPLIIRLEMEKSASKINLQSQILIQHILVFSFLLEKSSMDGVYVIFILVEHHLSFFSYFYILEELYLMVLIFIIQILGFQELFFSSS